MERGEEALAWAKKQLGTIADLEKERHGDQSTVYHLTTERGSYVLKVAKNLEGERERLAWLSGKAPVPQVLDYLSLDDGIGALLMTKLAGKDLASHKKDWEPEVLVKRLASVLRDFHAIDAIDCPFGSSGKEMLLVHGDACLPNFIFEGDQFSGYVDLGDMRIDRPEVDLSAAVWSLQFNLGPGYGPLFLEEYGYSNTSEETIKKLRLKYEETQREWNLSA